MINKVFIVSELISHLSNTLDADPLLNDIWITGEVANATTSSSGHTYFSLREEKASFRCVLFSRYTGAEHVVNGSQVNVHGHVTIYAARGEIQLTSDIVQPVGIGLMAAEFELLRQKLEEEGLFDPTRKRVLPELPKLIGLVTSETGAVFHDISNTLSRRYPVAELLLSAVQVQGDKAENGISEAIKKLNKVQGIDAIIIARGGGSLEDLHAFNSERVARAIHASKVPVISGVGHETDVTIADWVADIRAPTPTAAAELVSPSKDAIYLEIATIFSRSWAFLSEKVMNKKLEVEKLASTMEQVLPNINDLRQSVDLHLLTAKQSVGLLSSKYQTDLEQNKSALFALNPKAVLKRGYSVIELEDGKRVTSASLIKFGSIVKATLLDGYFNATVTHGEISGGKEPKSIVNLSDEQFEKSKSGKKVVKNDRNTSSGSEQRKLF